MLLILFKLKESNIKVKQKVEESKENIETDTEVSLM